MKPIPPILTLTCFLFLGVATARDNGPTSHGPRLQEQVEIVASFARLSNFQSAIAGAELTAFEGLPHPFIDPDVVENELETKDTIERQGFHFYEKPVAFPDGFVEWLRAALEDSASFREFTGFKACGGFHPDWSLVWSSGDLVTEFHICFGCGEIRAYQGAQELYCDMSPKGAKKLGRMLKEYRVQRPK